MLQLDRVLSLLQSVKKSAKGYTARCPGHDDQQASLSVSAGDDGRVLLKCFAGCPAEQIVSAVGLKLADLFPQNGRGGRGVYISPRTTRQHVNSPVAPSSNTQKQSAYLLNFFSKLGFPKPTSRAPRCASPIAVLTAKRWRCAFGSVSAARTALSGAARVNPAFTAYGG